MPQLAEVKAYLAGQAIEVMEFAQLTPTAETAAAAVGCSVGEIAKTLLFLIGGQPVAAVVAGDRRVSSSRLKLASGLRGSVRLPAAAEVLRFSGYAPGGVCPFLLPSRLPVLVDSSLRRFAVTYPAAGNTSSAAAVTFAQLLNLSGGREADLCNEAVATPTD